jgi:hypothetical protein
VPDSGKKCFVIAPIGGPDSATRVRSNKVLDFVIKPVLEPAGYDVLRADQLGKPGMVTRQVIDHIATDDLVIADLTDQNPNVFYELSLRHALKLPLIQLIDSEQELPFDVRDTRTIFFDILDLYSVEDAKKELATQLQSLEEDPRPIESPISLAIDLEDLRSSGDPDRAALGEILEAISDLRAEVRSTQLRRVEMRPLATGDIGALTADDLPRVTIGETRVIRSPYTGGVIRTEDLYPASGVRYEMRRVEPEEGNEDAGPGKASEEAQEPAEKDAEQ